MGICQTCGGVNGPYGTKEVVDIINTGAPNPWAFLCIGHDKPKHDGKLDEDTFVQYDGNQQYSGERVAIVGYPRGMALTPKQALSLLSWLQQEQPTLEKMVGVEKGTSKE